MLVKLLGTEGTFWHAALVDTLLPSQQTYAGFKPLFMAKFEAFETRDEVIAQLLARKKTSVESYDE